MGLKGTSREIAHTLEELTAYPFIKRIIRAMGEQAALALLEEVLYIEAAGGMYTQEGRLRTRGGMFFHLVDAHLTPDLRDYIYRKNQYKQGGHPPRATPLPRSTPTWHERGEGMTEAHADAGTAHTVKLSIVGKLGKVVEKPRFALAMLTHTPQLAHLQKGIPRPPAATETTYVLSIGGKQWRQVKEALLDPDEVAIIEGIPMWDAAYQAMTVFVTSITTRGMRKAQHQARRQARQDKAGKKGKES